MPAWSGNGSVKISFTPSSTKSASLKSSSPSPSPPATPLPSPSKAPSLKTEAAPKTGAFQNSFFSIKGQAERIQNVGAVFNELLNPWAKRGIKLTNPSTGAQGTDVTSALRLATFAAPAVYAAGSVAAGSLAVGSATAGAAAKLASPSLFKAGLIGAGAGFLGSSLLRGGNAAPQNSSQDQKTSNTTNANQTSNQFSPSWYNQNQYTYNTIRGSPGASINSSPGLSATNTPTLSPYQNIPNYQNPSQSSDQGQSLGSDLLIPALILGAAFLFSRR